MMKYLEALARQWHGLIESTMMSDIIAASPISGQAPPGLRDANNWIQWTYLGQGYHRPRPHPQERKHCSVY